LTNRKFLVIANPVSGKRKAPEIVKALGERLDGEGFQKEVKFTSLDLDAKEIVMAAQSDEYTDLVIVGGDGTLNQAINGLQKSNWVISTIPAGTGNDFVKNIEIGKALKDQIETVVHGTPRLIDVGVCNKRKFINGVGIGFDGQIVYEMLHKKTFLTGHAAYYYHVLRILASYIERSFMFSIDKKLEARELILMTVGNGTTFGGGFKLTPNAQLDDGLLDVCLVGRLSPLRRFLNVGKLSTGTHLTLQEIEERKCSTISIEENSMLEAHIDGEYLGNPPFEIQILPKAIQIRSKA